MIAHTTLPKSFKPYQRLSVCGNLIIGGGHLIAIGKVLPLLIGSGEIPMIWLQAPADHTAKTYVPLVTASVASHPAVSIVNDSNGLLVSVEGTPVIHISQTDTESATIDLLDLRPIGLNIFGNVDSLNAGNATFTGSTFSGEGTLLSFSGV